MEEALRDFQLSLEYRQSMTTVLEIAESEVEIGKILAMRGDHDEALSLFKAALARVEETENRAVISSALLRHSQMSMLLWVNTMKHMSF